MNAFGDTWTMTKRSLRHTVRSMDTIITVVIQPIAILLMFVYIFGGMFESGVQGTYVDYITPGVTVITVISGIAYAALRLNNDLTMGIINRFKTMPVSPSAILNGHVVSAVVSNFISVGLVLIVAAIAGFRPHAGLSQWLIFLGILFLFTLAMSWLAMVFGLAAKSAEGAGAFVYLLFFAVFVSSAFVPTDTMGSVLRTFAEHQPLTPIVETMRSLLVDGTAGNDVWTAVGWCVALLAVSYFLAIAIYKRRTA